MSPTQPALKDWVVGALVAQWATDQLQDKSIAIQLGDRVLSYRQLPDGSFVAPPGVTTQLIKNANGTYKLSERFGTVLAFDANRRIQSLTDIDGNALSFTYTGDLLTQVKDAYNRTLTLSYTAGKLTQVADNQGRAVTYSYTGNDLTQFRDPENKLWQYGYDASHQILTVTDPVNAVIVSNAYDDRNRVTQQTAPRDNNTTGLYQLHYTGLSSAEQDPAGQRTTYYYDTAGRTVAVENALGQIAKTAYDRLNRLTQTDHLADTSQDTFSYDGFGDLIQTQNGDVTYTYAYDAKHRLKSKTDSRAGKTLSWAYDPAGNIDTKTDYQGDVTDYQYDNANRLVAETNPNYLQVSYHYDGAGRLIDRILSNGAITNYGWDAAGRLTQLKNTTITGQLVNNTGYTRDRIGNVLTQTEAGGTGQPTGITGYSYDPEYRLLTADYPGTANDEAFSYDKVGNRKTYTKAGATKYYNVDAGNRLKDIRTGSTTGTVYESYGYDDNGSLTTINAITCADRMQPLGASFA
ncbi:RHS repeat protein [Methylomonas sp. DH-1]|uniref:RHS repeat protein n=1 Tax=Methylomonas sp. (strain DH-1) TaxID=1727196 RepID=UPI0007C918C1|nr:RHS repeat protein [Methylomonas sp. DH-1]ANE58013.1 hypothetical protein AYM39_22290 [Methylomonas sp. DH-1]